nr:hypothetical protein GCM10025732_35930 [Glycomyces mayteni]
MDEADAVGADVVGEGAQGRGEGLGVGEGFARGVEVAGVQAQADLGDANGVKVLGGGLERGGHRVGGARGGLDEEPHRVGGAVEHGPYAPARRRRAASRSPFLEDPAWTTTPSAPSFAEAASAARRCSTDLSRASSSGDARLIRYEAWT